VALLEDRDGGGGTSLILFAEGMRRSGRSKYQKRKTLTMRGGFV
jgi:1-acyl-sn-glycerol-3-phosphate acyltransferase